MRSEGGRTLARDQWERHEFVTPAAPDKRKRERKRKLALKDDEEEATAREARAKMLRGRQTSCARNMQQARARGSRSLAASAKRRQEQRPPPQEFSIDNWRLPRWRRLGCNSPPCRRRRNLAARLLSLLKKLDRKWPPRSRASSLLLWIFTLAESQSSLAPWVVGNRAR